MHIKRTFEHPDGAYEVDAVFTPDEVQVIIEVGLNTLYQSGALPFTALGMKDLGKLAPINGTPQ